MTESITDNVAVAAAIASAERPHIPPPRYCRVCSAPAAAGSRWCDDCRAGR